MGNFSAPKVTIDLSEYEHLQKIVREIENVENDSLINAVNVFAAEVFNSLLINGTTATEISTELKRRLDRRGIKININRPTYAGMYEPGDITITVSEIK